MTRRNRQPVSRGVHIEGFVVDARAPRLRVRQQFTSKERDSETGLDYFLARYYSSLQGRFISPDEFTVGPRDIWVLGSGAGERQALVYAEITTPQSLNKYQFTFNNPLRYVDPDGHNLQDPLALDWDVKDLAEGRITEKEYRERQQARGIGAIAGTTIVVSAIFGPRVATAVVAWAMRNPEKAQQLTQEPFKLPVAIPQVLVT